MRRKTKIDPNKVHCRNIMKSKASMRPLGFRYQSEPTYPKEKPSTSLGSQKLKEEEEQAEKSMPSLDMDHKVDAADGSIKRDSDDVIRLLEESSSSADPDLQEQRQQQQILEQSLLTTSNNVVVEKDIKIGKEISTRRSVLRQRWKIQLPMHAFPNFIQRCYSKDKLEDKKWITEFLWEEEQQKQPQKEKENFVITIFCTLKKAQRQHTLTQYIFSKLEVRKENEKDYLIEQWNYHHGSLLNFASRNPTTTLQYFLDKEDVIQFCDNNLPNNEQQTDNNNNKTKIPQATTKMKKKNKESPNPKKKKKKKTKKEKQIIRYNYNWIHIPEELNLREIQNLENIFDGTEQGRKLGIKIPQDPRLKAKFMTIIEKQLKLWQPTFRIQTTRGGVGGVDGGFDDYLDIAFNNHHPSKIHILKQLKACAEYIEAIGFNVLSETTVAYLSSQQQSSSSLLKKRPPPPHMPVEIPLFPNKRYKMSIEEEIAEKDNEDFLKRYHHQNSSQKPKTQWGDNLGGGGGGINHNLAIPATAALSSSSSSDTQKLIVEKTNKPQQQKLAENDENYSRDKNKNGTSSSPFSKISENQFQSCAASLEKQVKERHRNPFSVETCQQMCNSIYESEKMCPITWENFNLENPPYILNNCVHRYSLDGLMGALIPHTGILCSMCRIISTIARLDYQYMSFLQHFEMMTLTEEEKKNKVYKLFDKEKFHKAIDLQTGKEVQQQQQSSFSKQISQPSSITSQNWEKFGRDSCGFQMPLQVQRILDLHEKDLEKQKTTPGIEIRGYEELPWFGILQNIYAQSLDFF